MRVLLTSTSFQDSPGKHQELLNNQGFKLDKLRGPIREAELLPIIQNYDAVICGDDEYTAKVLKKGAQGRLKYISKYGVGLDKIDLNAAKALNIPVTNCPGVNQVSVAEHVLALLFTFEKNVHLQYNSTLEGSWNRWVGHEVHGKIIGIIGLGAIGKELAIKSLALGLRVIAFDKFRDQKFLNRYPSVVFANNIDVIYQEANFISLHVPHTNETDSIIDKKVVQNKLKKTPIIINTSRGRLVDSEAILLGIKNKMIRGYLADVLKEEPITSDEILRGVENVIITPHVGSRTYESIERQGLMAVNNLLGLLKND